MRTLVTGFRATLIQGDLTLINLQRLFFQIRSQSEVPGRHVFGAGRALVNQLHIHLPFCCS